MKSRTSLVWTTIRDSLWFVPSICTIAASLLAILLLTLESRGVLQVDRGVGLVFGAGAESARALLGAVAGGLITVTGVAFSIMIVALELSSSQYTPRVLPNFMGDRANQIVIGILIGTFTYSLLVLRAIESDREGAGGFVPRVAITTGMLLALVSVGALIYFINHAARSIQISWILERTTHHALGQVSSLFPEEFGREDRAIHPEEEPPDEHVRIPAPHSGYLQAVDEGEIFESGRAAAAIIRLEHRIGAFILEGEALAIAWPAKEIDERTRMRIARAFSIGRERTREQDYELSLIEITDIAVKALSPGINDPTTAQQCIDRLSQLLLALALRHAPTRIRTKHGQLHVIVRDLPFDRAVEAAFFPILHFGASNPAIRERLIHRLESLIRLVPEQRRWPLEDLRRAVLEHSSIDGAAPRRSSG